MDFKNALNKNQYEAVTSKAKYNRVIAGAGSGKTRVLTYRIAYLIKELNFDPRSILAITFTNKAANEMKERALNLLKDVEVPSLQISTFHSFCASILRKEIHVLDFPSSFTILDEADTKSMIKLAIEDCEYQNYDLLDSALNFISKNKTKGNLPSDLNTSFFNELDKKCYDVFKAYEKRKNAQYSLDFDDLLIYVILILERFPEIKEKYNRRYKEILIDEFQDTNDLQFDLVKLLAKTSNVYVVGDPDQTIYTWRGANLDIILNIEKIYKPLKTTILNENYRSTKEILTAANSLISFNKDRVPKDLYTNNENGTSIEFYCAIDNYQEAKWIVRKIFDLNQEGVKFNEITILYRSNYLSRAIERELMESHIKYKIYGGIGFYERKEIKDAVAYFNLLVNSFDDISFLRVINVPRREIGEKSVAILKTEAKLHNLSLFNYAKDIHKFDSALTKKTKATLTQFSNIINTYKEKVFDPAESYSEIINEYIDKLGYKEYLAKMDEEDNNRLENLSELIADIRMFASENPDSTFSEYLQNITLITSQDAIKEEENHVSLMSIHTAKGLEFNYCFVLGLNDSIFPNLKAIQTRNGMEEERRLCYVAFTRAKKRLFVSCNQGYSFSTRSNLDISPFIKEANIFRKNNFQDFKKPEDSDKEKYIIDFMDNRGDVYKEKPKFFTEKKNNIDWKIGDKLFHTVFKKGVVIEVEGDILTIDFDDFGIKNILKFHHMLKKID